MDLTIIAAVSDNGVIGDKNMLLWRIPEDMARFKSLTTGHPVIMGRNTYDSIPPKFRPLPDRKNIVLSSTMKQTNGIYIAKNIEEAIALAENQDTCVIGGSKVYEQFMPLANKLEITRVHNEYKGDAVFPYIDPKEWELIIEQRIDTSKSGIPFSFMQYRRK